jgi:hypothetical protein
MILNSASYTQVLDLKSPPSVSISGSDDEVGVFGRVRSGSDAL